MTQFLDTLFVDTINLAPAQLYALWINEIREVGVEPTIAGYKPGATYRITFPANTILRPTFHFFFYKSVKQKCQEL
mgnify:CR=1 FL=1